VTRSRQPSDCAADGDIATSAREAARAPRARRAARRLLTRVLPGGVMVAAALTLPELSVGAGDTGRGPAAADPPQPPSQTGLDRATRARGTSKGPFAGVRYGGLLEVRTSAAATAGRDDLLSQPSDLAAPQSGGGNARGFDAGRKLPVAAAELDRAATYAASVLTDFAAPPGLPLDPALAARTPMASPETDALDRAAIYSASVIETFVEQAAPRSAPAAATAPAPGGGVLSATVTASASAPTSVALQAVAAPARAVLPAGSAAPTGAAAATAAPSPVAAPAPAPLVAPRPSTPTSPRSMIEQVTPARIAAARAAPVLAPVPAAVATARPAAKPAPLAAAAPKAPAPAPLPAAVAAAVPKPAPTLSAPVSAAPPRVEAPAFSARLLTRIDGRTSGEVDFQQTPAGLKVRLGSVAEVLADRLPASELARIRGSAAGNAWLSLAELQAQGIPISYDPVYDEFNIGREDTRPRAARKVTIDQISAPERGAGAGTMDQIRRP
jgi:hypothetical protein